MESAQNGLFPARRAMGSGGAAEEETQVRSSVQLECCRIPPARLGSRRTTAITPEFLLSFFFNFLRIFFYLLSILCLCDCTQRKVALSLHRVVVGPFLCGSDLLSARLLVLPQLRLTRTLRRWWEANTHLRCTLFDWCATAPTPMKETAPDILCQ